MSVKSYEVSVTFRDGTYAAYVRGVGGAVIASCTESDRVAVNRAAAKLSDGRDGYRIRKVADVSAGKSIWDIIPCAPKAETDGA